MTNITLPRAVVQQALEALEYASTGNRRPEVIGPAITAIREALAEQPAQQQEPVAWILKCGEQQELWWEKPPFGETIPLYTFQKLSIGETK